jgi:hypothetical protein
MKVDGATQESKRPWQSSMCGVVNIVPLFYCLEGVRSPVEAKDKSIGRKPLNWTRCMLMARLFMHILGRRMHSSGVCFD